MLECHGWGLGTQPVGNFARKSEILGLREQRRKSRGGQCRDGYVGRVIGMNPKLSQGAHGKEHLQRGVEQAGRTAGAAQGFTPQSPAHQPSQEESPQGKPLSPAPSGVPSLGLLGSKTCQGNFTASKPLSKKRIGLRMGGSSRRKARTPCPFESLSPLRPLWSTGRLHPPCSVLC